MKLPNINLKKILTDNWIVTVTATMLGVLSGIFLSEYFSHRAQLKNRDFALEEIKKELIHNEQLLTDYDSVLELQVPQLLTWLEHTDALGAVSVPIEYGATFLSQVDSVFKVIEIDTVDNDRMLRFTGGLTIKFNSPLYYSTLSDVRWKAFNQADYSQLANIECLAELENIFELQNSVNELNQMFIEEYFWKIITEIPVDRKEFNSTWQRLNFKMKLLIKLYQQNESTIDRDCFGKKVKSQTIRIEHEIEN